jgi:hypothetical protein
MPAKKKTELTTDAKEVLNGGGAPDAPAVDDQPGGQGTEEHDNGKAEVEPLTAEQIELQELRAQLAEIRAAQEAKPAAQIDHRPKPESELTPEQKQIRELQDQLARARGKNIENAEEVFEENVEGGILVHFLEDGLTSNGRTFYRGQEVTFGKVAYEETKDRFGQSWLTMSEDEQYARWGTVKFRRGPWPGKRSYEEENLKNVSISETAPIVNL